VAAYPTLLRDTSLYSYRYVNKRNEAWRRVADIVGAPGGVFVLLNSRKSLVTVLELAN